MANRGNTWAVPAGQSESFTVTIKNAAGAMTGVYDGTEVLAAVAWKGSDLAAADVGITLDWNDAAAATVDVVVAPDSALTPGFYRVRLSVTKSGVTSPFYFGWIRIEAIPGSAAVPATYATLQDLVDLGGEWVTQLMQSQAGDETDCLSERARAREWLDDIIVGASRVFAYRWDLQYALYYGSYPFGPVEAPDTVVRNYLASDFLLVKPRTIECVSYKALEFICLKRMTFDSKGDDYRARAAYYHRAASNSLRRYRCELDIDGDSVTDIAFNLGVISMR